MAKNTIPLEVPMDEQTRQALIISIQGEIKALQQRYRREKISLDVLQEAAKPLNRLQKTVNFLAAK
jgi:GH35 family endo-1,4-beta-xylanase